jgi:mono/diheme cytochrome c family protein
MEGAKRAAAVALIFVPALLLVSRSSSQGVAQKGAQNDQIERGRYLVEEVAECGECHTPRDAQGQLKRNSWLQGGPIWITPVVPDANWAPSAPPLAGLGSFTPAQVERVLEQGVGPEGEALRPPMHIYHMKPEDAKAIVAYLNSLPRTRH